MNFTLGLPEISMISSTCLYVGNNTIMGHIFLGLSVLLAFGRLVMDMHKSEEKKKEKETQIGNVKDSILKAASYMSLTDNAKH